MPDHAPAAAPAASAPDLVSTEGQTKTESVSSLELDSKASPPSPSDGNVDKPDSGIDPAKNASPAPKYKVKVNGEEREVDIDTALRDYQLREASNQRFKEASEKDKQAQAFLDLLKKDPRKVLMHPEIGVDLKKFATEILNEALEEEMLDPKDKALRDAQARIAAMESEDQARKETARQEQEKALTAQYAKTYSEQIGEALKTSGLPQNANVAGRVRDYMLEALDLGYEVEAKDVIKFVKEDYINDIKTLFGASNPEILADLLGEDSLKKVRQWDMQRLKDPSKGRTPGTQAPEKPREKEAPAKTVNQYFDDLNKKFAT